MTTEAKYTYTPPFPAPGSAPLRWADFKWPRWVPADVRKLIEEFWSEESHRSPRAWQESFQYAYANHPPFGAKVKCGGKWGSRRIRAGRWVPMWNNIGRLVCRNGDVLLRTPGDIIRERNSQLNEPSA